MIKLIAFFAILLGLAFGFSQIAETPGHMLLQLGENEYRVSLITGLLAFLAFTIGVMVLWSVLRLIFRLPSLVGFANRMRRQAKGQNALARGLVAVGVGDQRLAQRYASESQRLLGNEPLALLLRAQSAQLAGDAKGAEAAFKSMLDTPETQVLGLRGLHVEAERRNDAPSARLFAEEAYRRAPDAPWAGAAMLGLRAQDRDWRGAIGIIDQSVSRRLMDRDSGKAQRAVLLAAAAQDALESNPDEALTLAQDALRITPGLVAAAEIAGRRLSARGDFSKATKVLEAAWKENPHPDLADAYLNVRHGDSALDRLKRARTLLKLAPNARESRLALARAALDAREFSTAREALEALVLQKPTARACLLMAELEEVESGNQGLVRSWLARASRAPRDPAWVADGVVLENWSPVSPVTGRIGAFEWIEPPQAGESTLRARIDADRFETVPALIPAEAVAQSEPLSAQTTGLAQTSGHPQIMPDLLPPVPDVSQSVQDAIRASSSLDVPTPTKIDVAVQPFIPDDPGPDPSEQQAKRGFRFFG